MEIFTAFDQFDEFLGFQRIPAEKEIEAKSSSMFL